MSVDPYTNPALYQSVDTAEVTSSGHVEYVMPEAGGGYLVAKVVGDTVMYGNATDADGGWVSQSGTVSVSDSGVVSYGITDPTTGDFLPGGSTRVIDGQTVYGYSTGSDGGWISESGTTVITSTGYVETGKLDGTDFLEARTVDGKLMYGNAIDADGGWVSQSGTVSVSDSGVVSYGITDPTTGDFLPGGSTRVIDGQTVYGYSTGSDGGWISESETTFIGADGTEWSGHIDTATDEFVVQKDVAGTWMSGTPDDKGGWTSLNGDFYVNAQGVVSYGITDPTTHDFLPGGSTRVIDGQTVYGYSTGSDGGWISESGTTFIGADGTEWSGHIDTATDEFVVQKDVAGTWMSGTPDDEGGWTSLNGDFYVNAQGVVSHGITDPTTGRFLPDGVAKTVGGQSYYGFMSGGDFIADTGDTVILADGTILTGTLDSTGEIFTSTSGATFGLTDNGIEPAALQSDGSYLLSDGDVVMTAKSWAIDLPAFDEAIRIVQYRAAAIQDSSETITQQLALIHSSWTSPAGDWFEDEVVPMVASDLFQLNNSLNTVISTMQQSYANYVQTEGANVQNSSTPEISIHGSTGIWQNRSR